MHCAVEHAQYHVAVHLLRVRTKLFRRRLILFSVA